MNFKLITSLTQLPELSTDSPIFSDIETQYLYKNVRLIQIYQPSTNDTIYLLDIDHTDLEDIKEYLKDKWLVFYNSAYDLGTLNFVPEKLDDLFFATKIAYPELQRYSLDNVIDQLIDPMLYQGLDKKKLQKLGFVPGAYLSQNQLRYAATDVYALSKLWELPKIQRVMSDNLAYKVDILNQRYAIIYQQNGLRVDLELRDEMEQQIIKEVEEARRHLPSNLNVNSSKQVKEFLDIDNSRYDTLVQLVGQGGSKGEYAKYIIDLRKSLKRLGYIESIRHPIMLSRFNVYGAATGRFSSTGGDLDNGLNAQQIPRKFQPLFNKPYKDTIVISLDYSTLELRLAAAIYNEPVMYREFKEGKDLHTEMAILVTGKKLHPDGILGSEYDDIKSSAHNSSQYITKNDRTLAKSINFGYIFGMSSETYRHYAYVNYGVKLTSQESKEIRDKYFRKYPGIKKYHEYVWKNFKKPGFTYKTALGRIVKPRTGTEAINGPVQGSGAETTKLAIHYLIKSDPKALKYIINAVHDALYLRIPKEEEEYWKKLLKDAMSKGWQEISKTSLFHFKDIPMPLEYE